MSFVNQYRSTTIYGELKVQKYNTGNIAGLLDISGNTILQGSCRVDGNIFSNDGTVDISGNLTVSGNINGTATNSTNVTIATDATNASFYPMFVSTTSGNLPPKTDTNLSYNPSTNILTVPNITGTCSSATNSTNSTNANITLANTNATFYPTFVSSTGNQGLKIDTDLNYSYNPSTGLLSVPNINGVILNNALTNTITASSTDASFYPTFVSATTGNLGQLADSNLSYNPSTNILTVENINGTCSNVNVTEVFTNVYFRIPFLSGDSGSQTISSNEALTYNPNVGDLIISSINGAKITCDTINDNLAFGEAALGGLTTGTANTAFGEDSLQALTTGGSNSAFGFQALYINSTGLNNCAFGRDALSIVTSSNNSAFGLNALNVYTTGSQNTGIGQGCGANVNATGSRNTFLGATTRSNSTVTAYNNSTAVGFGAEITASNQIILGTVTETVKIIGSFNCVNAVITDALSAPKIYGSGIGVTILNGVPTAGHGFITLSKSRTSLSVTSITTHKADLTTGGFVGTSRTDNFNNLTGSAFIPYGWGIIGYSSVSYGGTIIINAGNNSDLNGFYVSMTTNDTMESCKIFFDGVEQA